VKNLNLAQVEFVDLLRRVNQTIQKPLTPAQPAEQGGQQQPPPGGPKLANY